MEMLNAMQKFVQESIDKGATSIEDVHKRLESMPLDFLAQITPLENIAKGSKEILNRSTGNVYESIRLVNMKVGEIAARMLGQEDAKETSA
ncbi:MAG: hypothetical protein IPH35_13795 [Rhodoferax sp.]|nr:hypothetical protein [Rhodoferax sp.]